MGNGRRLLKKKEVPCLMENREVCRAQAPPKSKIKELTDFLVSRSSREEGGIFRQGSLAQSVAGSANA
jgi:hypothetical protein